MTALSKRRRGELARQAAESAEATSRTRSDEKRVEYLAFVLAGETYAARISVIAEILRPPPITEVPRAPSPIVGVMSVRGRLVTVIDLRRRFALTEAPLDGKSRILLVPIDGDEYAGLLVDEVLAVFRLAESEVETASVLGGEQPAYLVGVGRPREREDLVLVLLDLRAAIAT
jgi:purine-binding chemotaxis protein CheW